jgi:small membrane protein
MAPFIIIVLVVLAAYAGTKRLSGLQVLGVIALTGIGIGFVIFPGVSTRVANLLGVGRGTDLIFYLAVLGGLFVASNFYFRFKRHEEALISLARQSAIDHAHEPDGVEITRLRPQGDRTVEQVQQNLNRIEP